LRFLSCVSLCLLWFWVFWLLKVQWLATARLPLVVVWAVRWVTSWARAWVAAPAQRSVLAQRRGGQCRCGQKGHRTSAAIGGGVGAAGGSVIGNSLGGKTGSTIGAGLGGALGGGVGSNLAKGHKRH
jgi:uncharacterized protein YcfJ